MKKSIVLLSVSLLGACAHQVETIDPEYTDAQLSCITAMSEFSECVWSGKINCEEEDAHSLSACSEFRGDRQNSKAMHEALKPAYSKQQIRRLEEIEAAKREQVESELEVPGGDDVEGGAQAQMDLGSNQEAVLLDQVVPDLPDDSSLINTSNTDGLVVEGHDQVILKGNAPVLSD